MEVSRAEAEGPGTWGMCTCSYWVLQTSMPTFCCLAFAVSLTLTMLSCPWEQHMLFLWKSWQLVRYFCPKEWISFTKGVWVPVFLTFFPLLVKSPGIVVWQKSLVSSSSGPLLAVYYRQPRWRLWVLELSQLSSRLAEPKVAGGLISEGKYLIGSSRWVCIFRNSPQRENPG